MKNIHIVPTDKPSMLVQRRITKELKFSLMDNPQLWNNVNIYITNDEDFKEGWYFNTSINRYTYVYYKDVNSLKNIYGTKPEHLQKIILTDNEDLIADGVQAIDDEFLEWFVKNPSCEWVEVEKGYLGMGGFCKSDEVISKDKIHYKIIIPEEEPKKETLEEKFQSWNELIKEVGNEEELLRILKLPHIAPLIREAMRSNCKNK